MNLHNYCTINQAQQQNFNRWFELSLSKCDFKLCRMNNDFRLIGLATEKLLIITNY